MYFIVKSSNPHPLSSLCMTNLTGVGDEARDDDEVEEDGPIWRIRMTELIFTRNMEMR